MQKNEKKICGDVSNLNHESPGVVAIDDKLYAMGGACVNVETEQIDCYDPLSNKWEEFTPLPLAIEGMGVAVM